ncbi:Endoribonuclease L-PSP [Chlamydia abortus]|uniref:RidA family protein n=1 Tax=Paenibacillus residui TaxID=629724 RepID=A0ABW3DIT6_9BACL|nr:RidA family protein [Paenibacillus sp. 32O-W]SHE11687.1 Endoribonuclease L-PSP [Chlamydia abortus]
MSLADERIKELGLILPKIDLQGKAIVPIRQHGNLLYTSGHGPEREDDGSPIWTGKLGKDLTVEEGYQAARECGIILLAQLKNYLGSLDRVDALVKVLGLVASSEDFYQQPQVMNGFSDLMVDVFGERGKHARSAMGTYVLPKNIPVEIEMIVRIRD